MDCPARSCLRDILAARHVRASRRDGDGWLWTCSCTSDWNRHAATWEAVEVAFGWHLAAVERLRRAPVDLRVHVLPDIDPSVLRAPVVDVELPPWG